MQAALTRIVRSSWYKVMKVSLMLLSFAFIYYHISQEDVVMRFLMMKSKFLEDETTRNYIYAALALMPFNWLCEAVKWKWLTSSFYNQSLLRAARGVLTGVAISFFTPNRTGDFAGRILLLPPGYRLNGALFSIAGSLAQLLVTVSAGGLALMLLADVLFKSSANLTETLYIITPLAVLALHIIFIGMPVIGDKLSHLKAKNKWIEKLRNIRHIESMLLARVYILSILRYAIFTLQFYLLIHAFGLYLDDFLVIALIMISFLLITIIPSYALSEIGIRGSVTIFLFSSVTNDVTVVLVAATALWLINIVIPAIAGATGMLYFKIEE